MQLLFDREASENYRKRRTKIVSFSNMNCFLSACSNLLSQVVTDSYFGGFKCTQAPGMKMNTGLELHARNVGEVIHSAG